MNLTLNSTTSSGMIDYYIICSLSGILALIAVATSIMILISVWRTKPALHTVRHLLTCNTCVASIFYCIIQAVNYGFLIFYPEDTSNISCRWRGYFAYISICGVAYSFLIQAISRLFISIFSTKYRWLVKYKVHRILIAIQWFVSIVVPLPAIITKDIYFRPDTLCWVPLKRTLHVFYTYFAYYVVPIISIFIIYIFIYYRVKKIANEPENLVPAVNRNKRDLKLLRNIVVLLVIYFAGGIPTLLFIVTSIRTFYLIGIVTISLAVAVEKVCTILLDRELLEAIRKSILKSTRITPIYHTQPMMKYQENLTAAQAVVVPITSYRQQIFLKVIR